MRKFLSLILTSAFLASGSVCPALADDWREHGDIHHFHEHDYDHWRGGSWFNGLHGGRHGWWWIVDGAWYFYPAPVYPYPDPYTPPVVVTTPAPVSPVGVPPSYVYYCRNPAGYYPYVPQCLHWHRVVAGTTTTIIQQPATVVTQPAPAPYVPPAAASAPTPYMPPAGGGTREADEKKLNELAADFQNVDPTGQQASGRLKEISNRLDAFKETLSKRSYNPMDILKNVDDLQHHIAEERAHLGAPPAAGEAPPPEALPPGSKVNFPPQ
ncbi:MAG: hypothetical protein WCD70_13105 [Alphaproteobacteria bacterium]